jgi:hypothetical protein
MFFQFWFPEIPLWRGNVSAKYFYFCRFRESFEGEARTFGRFKLHKNISRSGEEKI